MKILKLKTTDVQHTSQGMLSNYYAVKDTYVINIDNEDDVSSVDSLYIFSMAGHFDYNVFRDSIKTNLIPNWANLLYEDRKKCILHFKYPTNISQTEFDGYFLQNDHESNWNVLTARSRVVRLQRLYAAFNKISYALPEMAVALIYMKTKDMCYDYYYANLPNVILWLQNGKYPALGIDFTNNGFAQQPGYSIKLMYELLDIFGNGNYQNAENKIQL